MQDHTLVKLVISVVVIIVLIVISQILKKYAKTTQIKFELPIGRYYLLKRIVYTINIFVGIILLIMIWGVDIMDLWVSITGILAMVAIGLVATWSLLANALAGMILYFISPFKTDDHIEIMPDNVKGNVLTINVFYTVLVDEEDNRISVPNTIFYLKYIKVAKRK